MSDNYEDEAATEMAGAFHDFWQEARCGTAEEFDNLPKSLQEIIRAYCVSAFASGAKWSSRYLSDHLFDHLRPGDDDA